MSRSRLITVSPTLRAMLASTVFGTAAFAELSAPAGVHATDGSSTNAVDVSWIAVDGASGYRVLRALPGETFEEIVSTPDTLHRDVTAIVGTTYEYRVVAFDDAEESPASEIDPGWRNTTAPTPFDASDGTVGGGVELTWLPSENALAYRVYRINGGGNAPPQEIGETEGTSFLVDASPSGQVRTYTARALTASGFSDFAEPDAGFAGLPAPQNLRASDGTFSRWVFLRWNNVPQNTGYRILRSAEGEAEIQIGTSDGPVYKDETAVPGTIHTYRVVAELGDGATEASAPDTGWRGLPRPIGLEATDGSSTTEIDLSWPEMPGATSYRLLRSTPGTSWEVLAEVEATSYADSISPAGVQIHYRLIALVGELASRPSAPETGWRNVEAPTGLAASDGTFLERVEVVWNASPEDAVIGYEIHRRLPTDPDGLLIGSVEADESPVFDDTEIAPGVIGTYWVCAVVKPGCSAGSDSDTGFRATGSGFAASLDGENGPSPTTGPDAADLSTDSRNGNDRSHPQDAAPSTARIVAAGDPDASLDADALAPPRVGPATTSRPTMSPSDADRSLRTDRDETAAVEVATTEGLLEACADLRWRLELLAALGVVEPSLVEDPGDDRTRDLAGDLVGDRRKDGRVAGDFDPCAIWRGDLDGDGRVDEHDLAAFLDAVERNDPIHGDLDRDGVVGPHDAVRMIERLGTSLATD